MLEQYLQALDDQHLRRRLITLAHGPGPTATLQNREVILMASNNYLGLAAHPTVKEAAIEAIERFGVGAGAARLVSGTLPPHTALEHALARFHRKESALLFPSGYMANLGLLPMLSKPGGVIFADRLCHASLIDGCRLSGAEFRVFRHRDLNHLEAWLRRKSTQRDTLIVTEGIFSMDGDAAPLPELIALAEKFDAQLFVDDAHGMGVMGDHGRGTIEYFQVETRVPFHMGTLGKALGTSGAFLVGPGALVDYTVNTCRPFLFSTASPPSTAAASLAALQVLQKEPDRRTRLWDNRGYFHTGLTRLGFTLTETISPILPVLVGSAETALAMAKLLLEHGVFAPAIRPPTVPKGGSRIRVTVTADHTREHLDTALNAFEQAGRYLALI